MNETYKTTAYDQNPELIESYRAGDSAAGDRLVEMNLPLVYSIASRFRERCDDFGDLVECGTLGLVKAIKTFDPERGCAFSTYAVPLILGEVRRFLRDDGIIKVSREEKRLSVIINRGKERRRNLGLRCDVHSLAAALGMSPADVASAIGSEVRPRSLEESVFDDDDSTTLGCMIADESEATSFDRLALRMAIETLGEEHRRIVYLRYYKDYSQSETARILGLSQVKISREEKKIMRLLELRMT